jgi:hypothetical protein
MNIVLKLNQYSEKHVYFCEPIKNTIMNEGNFIRILYSTNQVVFNGIYLLITLNDIICEKYYNKYKYIFNINNEFHKNLIENLKNIEESILKNINIENKIPQFKITEQLKNGYIKLFQNIQTNNQIDQDYKFILKISGIWENNHNYGLTYKFIKIYQ